MIPCFPDPYPDEIFYSICARYSDRVQYPYQDRIFEDLFGCKRATAIVDLPCYLGYFINNLPIGHNYTIDYFIDNHTLFPFFSPFLPQERFNRLRNQMITGNGLAIHTGVFSPPRLRYCQVCVEQDRARFGECYWHRLHQVPGVEVCPSHKLFLEESTILTRNSSTDFFSAERTIRLVSTHPTFSSAFFQTLLDIATDISYLLEHSCTPLSRKIITERYKALFAMRGFGFLKSNRLNLSRNLLNAFIDYYSVELLSLLHCEMKLDRLYRTWLARLTHDADQVHNPLFHILAIRFLDLSIEAFLDQKINLPKPFGNGPWPCLNPVCEYYRQRCITTCQITKVNKDGRPIARFSCICGFTYNRLGPDQSSEDEFRKDRTISYGSVWEMKLRDLWFDAEVGLEDISRYLQANRYSIKGQATKLHLPMPRKPSDSTIVVRGPRKDISWYREQWLKLVDEFPEASNCQLKIKMPGVYSRLYNYDREWFDMHRPFKKSPKDPSLRASKPLNVTFPTQEAAYSDAEKAEAVKAAAQRIMSLDPPERVTLQMINKEVFRIKAWKQRRDKEPLTALALQQVLETKDAFVARCNQITRQKQSEGTK